MCNAILKMIRLRSIVTILWIQVALECRVWTIEIKWTKYDFEDASDGLSCSPTDFLFILDDVPDSYQCSKSCFLHNHCITAEFNPENFQCMGCSTSNYQALPWSENRILHSRRDYRIDCKDVLAKNERAKSGVYEIRLDNSEKIDVYCDMTTNGGGWTVFKRQLNNSVDFNKTFAAYESGFGDVNGGFWLGLHYIQLLTVVPSQMIINVSNQYATKTFQQYDSFKLIGENYEVIPVTSENFLSNLPLQRSPFYTYDKDTAEGCARSTGGGWWFHTCETLNFNGGNDMNQESRMMVRRR